jgi:HSP20 family molecular chaperone IbpA
MEVNMAYMIRRNANYDYFRDLARFVNNFMAKPEFDRELMGFPLDVIEYDKEYLVKASVAGFDPEKREITTITMDFRSKVRSTKKPKNQLKTSTMCVRYVRARSSVVFPCHCKSVRLPLARIVTTAF